MSRILIIHTPTQLEEASGLVDLLEASLSLPEGSLVCSSLPGYAWNQRVTGGGDPAEFLARLDSVSSVIALVDEPALYDSQLWFDLACAWARGLRLSLVLDSEERRGDLPAQLAGVYTIARSDRAALVTLIEDLAFDLGLSPRLSKDARQALELFSTVPPAPANSDDTRRAPAHPAAASNEVDEPLDTASPPPRALDAVPPPPRMPDTVPPPPRVPDAVAAREALEAATDLEAVRDPDEEDAIEIGDDDVEQVPPHYEPRPSGIERRLLCEAALEAGCAIAECSFHRDEGTDFSAELDSSYGSFIDDVGGSWAELRRLGDIELWLGATDNLLQGLPAARREIAEWYEVGFQFSTLRCIAEHGLPAELEQRAAVQELWNQSLAQFRNSAASARIAPRDIRRLQALLENLIGPEDRRDYANIGRVMRELRELAAQADRGALQVGATG